VSDDVALHSGSCDLGPGASGEPEHLGDAGIAIVMPDTLRLGRWDTHVDQIGDGAGCQGVGYRCDPHTEGVADLGPVGRDK